ncbi:hypothetical protein ANO14919_017580 [Xylariales sp. No.14919]|nr:hypothetical protein ANO14919_017580 [Xylariales sp. No.14919]
MLCRCQQFPRYFCPDARNQGFPPPESHAFHAAGTGATQLAAHSLTTRISSTTPLSPRIIALVSQNLVQAPIRRKFPAHKNPFAPRPSTWEPDNVK